MAQKFKLEFEPDYEFLLLGVVSYERDYRISWDINQNLKLDLVRTDDHSIKLKNSEKEMHFSCFIYEDENTYLNYKLLGNRSDDGYLLDDLKNIDYLVVVTGEYYPDLAKKLRDGLSKLESVQNCFSIEPEKIKNSHRVL